MEQDQNNVALEAHEIKNLYQGVRGLAIKILRLQEKLFLCFANKVITANAYFKNNLVERGAKREKAIIVNNVPNPAIFKRIKSKPNSLSKYAPFT